MNTATKLEQQIRHWWTAIPIYAFFGLALGLADAEFGRAAEDLGMRRGMATALSVNVLLPFIVVSLTFARPFFRTAWLGSVAMTLAFIVGLAIIYPPPGPWRPAAVLQSVPPVLVAAGVGYMLLGTLVVLARRNFSKRGEAT